MPYPTPPFAAIAWIAPIGALSTDALGALAALLDQAVAAVQGIYPRAPALVLALSALVVLPAVALISVALGARRRRKSRRAAVRAAERRAQASGLSGDIPDAVAAPASQSQAWLTVEGEGSAGTTALAGQVIRIGRHQDNDIRLTDRSVHRHHAVIERTSDEAFLIRDVSGKDGNGVRVNGRRTERAQLADGDVIELGRARLRFENAPV